jgi:hypothetical protein
MDSGILFAPRLTVPSFSVFGPLRSASTMAPEIGALPQHENLFMKNRLAKKNINRKQRTAITGKIHHHPAIRESHQNHMGAYLLIS